MTPVAESILAPNDLCVWGGFGYFLVPCEQSERIGVMRVKKKGEWTKSGVPKSLIRHKKPGQNVAYINALWASA